MALHIKNELITVNLGLRQLHVDCGIIADLVKTTAFAHRGIGGIKCQQCAGSSTAGYQKFAAIPSTFFGVGGGIFMRQRIGVDVHRRQRHGGVFAVGRGVNLDG